MTRTAANETRVLVVDDDEATRSGLRGLLEREGYAVSVAADGEAALKLARDQMPDLVITDLMMPNMSGEDLIVELKQKHGELPVIVLTGCDDVERAVGAIRAGAGDCVTKPLDVEELDRAITRVLGTEPVSQATGDGEPELRDLIGRSEPMRKVYELAHQVADAKAVVLITGESGTGKGALARAIHASGSRAEAPFVSVHSAALVDSLLESELFGHERGAFTGADRRRQGRFEQAEGGTLFLDEIGEISASTQVKLLRVLQERTFERVGGNDSIQVDVRLIAATSRDLVDEVERGQFREDLYYRLNVVHIELPPLRRRGDDVLPLADAFLQRFAGENKKRIRGFSKRAREAMREYPWPGNVRELENTIERAVVLCNGPVLDEQHLKLPDHVNKAGCARTLADIERGAIVSTLESVSWSTAKAAEILGISVRTVQYRLHQYGLAHKRRGR